MARPKKKTENEVIKASAAIQIEGKITLLQRRAWNVLLANAYDELPTKDRHAIRVVDLARTLEFNSDNDEYIKIALEALVGCKLKWNLLDKDGHMEWGVAALLAGAKIVRGICTYTYEPMLRERLYNPSMYARLSLLLQNRFESKHSLSLWELCTDYLGSKRDYGETPWIPLEDFRKLMGVADSQYYAALFKKLKEKVIDPAIAEINHVSDFNVTVEYRRVGRKVTALKFKMRRVALLPELATTQSQMFPDLEDMPLVVKELRDAGLSTQDAFAIWQQGFTFVDKTARPAETGEETEAAFLRYVHEKIHLLKRHQAAGTVANSTGFLREALRKNYANPEYAEALSKEHAKRQRHTAAMAQSEAALREERKVRIERRRDDEIEALCAQIVAAFPVVLDQAVAWARENSKGFNFVYKAWKSPTENYRDSRAVRAMLTPSVESQHPKGFEDIRTRYSRDIEALDRV